jgi:two-component system, NarL family, sensor histidine kinase UhpB
MGYQVSEDRCRSVAEDQTEVMIRIAVDGTTLFVNDDYCRFVGKTREELIGKKWQPNTLTADLTLIEAKLAALTPENPVVVVESRVHSGSGAVCWFQFVHRGFFDAAGRLVEIEGVGRDINALKLAEEALRKSEERLSLALSASRMGVWEWDSETDAIYWSPECFDIFALESFTGTLESFTNSIHPDDVQNVMESAEKSLAQGTDFMVEFRILRSDGEVRWLSDHGRPSYDPGGKALRLAGTVQDITDRKRSEESLKSLHEKMSDLSAHLETVREQECLAISREIHDEIGQTLTALKLDLSWVNHRVDPFNCELAERLAEMRANLDYLIAKAQQITAELRPPLLDNLGLAAAVEWQVREFKRRSGLDCHCITPESIESIDGKTATAVMRILLEALTNTLRHAHATQVRVCLSCSAEALELEVFDNGSGITVEQSSSASAYGIMGMQERARLCHGDFEIVGTPGKGTSVWLSIPLETGRPAGAEKP